MILSTVIFSKRRKISATLNRTQLPSPVWTASFYCTYVLVWAERDMFGAHPIWHLWNDNDDAEALATL